MVALTRKRKHKTLKRRRTRIKTHTTRRLKGVKVHQRRTHVKKNKTCKLQRGGLMDYRISTKLKKNIENIDQYKQFIKNINNQYLNKDNTINFEKLKKIRNCSTN